MSLNSNWREGLRPERELILCCTRTHLDDATAARIQELLRGPLSWSDVMATAFDHHVDPFMYQNLKAVGNGAVPAAWSDILRDTARKSGGMAVLYFSELLRIHEIFEAEDVPLIPYKGPVLGWLAYRSLTQRRFLDLDFFVPQRQMARAAAILTSAGYVGKFEKFDERSDKVAVVPGQYGFYREATQTHVELHTERTLRYFPVPLDFDKMSRRFITVDVSGRPLRTFSIEDTLVMLCVHGAKHFWDRLGWLLDVAELAGREPVDWALTMRIAAKLKSTRLLLLGVYLTSVLLDAPMPNDILARARKDRNVQWLASKVQAELAGGASPHMGVLPRATFRFRSRDGVVDGVTHMLRLTTVPTENDRRGVRLPKVLAPFYALVRPWILIRQYGIGLRPGARPDLAGYLPLRPDIVESMLTFAAVKPGDVLYDLGCGDGRIVVTAAEKFGIHAVGIDIDPRRIADANANARKHGVQDHVRFVLGDARVIDMSDATLVTMYLGARGNLRLSDTLKRQLRPGARIVSCDSEIYGWPCDERQDHRTSQGDMTSLYLWRVGDSRPKVPETRTPS